MDQHAMAEKNRLIQAMNNISQTILSTMDMEYIQDTLTEQINLIGKTVIPGLIDNHIHYLRGTNFAAYETRIHGVNSRAEVMSRITERA